MSARSWIEFREVGKQMCAQPDCRAWAVHGTEPARCVAHAPRETPVVVPEMAKVYASGYTDDELEVIAAMMDGELSLEHEIWLQRMLNRRLLHEARGADLKTLLRVSHAIGEGGWRVAQYMKAMKEMEALSGKDGDSELQRSIAQALDELSAELSPSLEGPPNWDAMTADRMIPGWTGPWPGSPEWRARVERGMPDE
jgi:hypothetical protein